MTVTSADVTTDVLVVGGGPCGALLANFLGIYDIEALVIDRAQDVLDYPRAVGIDDESLRSCQAVGLVHEVLADTLQNMPIRYYTSWGRCMAHVKPSTQPFGWPRRNLFLQPMLERTLRAGISRFGKIGLHTGHELVAIEQHDDHVTAIVRLVNGQSRRVQCSWLVGCDGGRSTVRDLIGATLEGTTEPVKWLVVDVADDALDAPFSAVYCDSDSPVLMVPLPYRHRRFEFRLREGEDEDTVTQPDHVRQRLSLRYGDLPLPRVVRARVYLHHSRVASTFRKGRVLLAGDAAHLQPPFFGQGMNSGLRDVTNLAWKIAAVARGIAGPELLSTYDEERRPHATEMVRFATRMGAMYRPKNALTERARDLLFRAVQTIPGGRDYILQMKYKPMPRYTSGVVTGADRRDKADPVGKMFPQPTVGVSGARRKLDDVIGPWFAVLCLVGSCEELDASALDWWRSMGASIVRIVPTHHATLRDDTPNSGASRVGAASLSAAEREVRLAEDVDGTFRDWCLARPGDEIVILRPDRYVAATCRRPTFAETTGSLRAILQQR